MRDFFQVDRSVFEASAPGRLDVMGGVADYCGSLVLQMPIAEKTTVRIQLTGEDFFTVVSDMESGKKSALVEVKEVLGWGDFGRVDRSTGLHKNFEKSVGDLGRVDTSTGLHEKSEEGRENFEKSVGGFGRVNTSTGLHEKNEDGGENFEKGGEGFGRVDTSTGLHEKNEDGGENFEKSVGGLGRIDTSTGLHTLNKASKNSQNSWTRYILGCFLLASREFGFQLQGARIFVTSDVPIGAGLSSSAALEVATLRALSIAYDLSFEDLQLGKLAQRVENEIVGAPCGLMDQLASHHGKPGKLLPIICQPAKLHSSIALPDDLVLVRVPSGVEHHITGDAYVTARTAAFMGYSMLTQQQGVSRKQLQEARESGNWATLPYQGYLANLDAKEFEADLEATLPETMLGVDFLKQGFVSIDQATTIDPKREYPVRAATAHPVYENACVKQFASLLAQVEQINLPRHQIFARLGLLMLSSHASYSAIGLGHEATDAIVHEVVAKGAKRGYYGARITGGGCGGTVVVLKKK